MKLYVKEKDSKKRKEFLDYLYNKGYKLNNCSEEELISSSLPITSENNKIDFVKTTLIASCSIKLHISIKEIKEILN